MKLLLIGEGRILYSLCKTFLAKGYAVTIVNENREECEELARRLNVTVMQGDGTDPALLDEAGAHDTETMLAVTPRDEDNLAACQLASLRFGIPRTIALVNDMDNEEVFTKLGIAAVSPTHVIVNLIEQRTAYDEITQLLPVGEGKINISEVLIKHTSPVVGKELKDITLPENSLLACIMREGEAIVPRGGTRLAAGDRAVLVTLPENHGTTLRAIMGED